MSLKFEEKEIDELIQKTIDKFTSLDKSKMHFLSEKGLVKVYKQEIPHEPLVVYGTSISPLTPDQLWKIMLLGVDEGGKELNPPLVSRDLVQEFSSEKHIAREVYTANSMMISDREFLYVNAAVKKDGEVFFVKKSLENVPDPEKLVRAKLTNVFHFTPQKDGNYEIKSMTQLVFGGWLPQWLIDKSTLDSPLFINEATKFVKEKFKN